MKKMNNKMLIGALVGLVIIFGLTKLFRSPGRESNINPEALKIDTANVTEISLYPKKDSAVEVTFKKDSGMWTAKRKDIVARVVQYKIDRIMDLMATLKPERVVTRKKEKWGDYDVSDSAATKVVIKEKSSAVTWYVGKENAGSTYIRNDQDDEVYAVNGSLGQLLNVNFASWRDQTFSRLTKANITEIDFSYPADSGFVVKKTNGKWMIDDKQADSVKVDEYLNKWIYRDHPDFADNMQVSSSPDITIVFKSSDNTEVRIKAWKKSFYQWVLNSSVQPKTNFLDQGNVIGRELFIGRKILTR